MGYMNRKEIKRIIEENRLGNLRKLRFSDCAIIMIDRLIYWSEQYPGGFYKHGNHCPDQDKLDGECWTKELPMSKATFKKYFKEIGLTHNSPEEYSKAKWKFGGRLCCCVLDKSNHKRTKYYINPTWAKVIKAVLAIDYSENSNDLDMGLAE
jgi:hypothetical protein